MSSDFLETLAGSRSSYDDILLGVLQKEEKIDKFIDCIFNFLCRRTDFFLVQETPDLPYGFPPNSAKQTVQKIFDKYDSISKEKLKQRLVENNDEIQNKIKPKPESKPKSEKSNENKLNDSNLDLKSKQEIFQSDPSSYNGAKREHYSWTQSIKDVDVRVQIPSEVKSSKDVRVKIDKEELKVSVINRKDGNWTNLISDKLAWKVKPDDCTWSLFPGDHIHIYLDKVQERWWEKLIESEEKLDVRNMNPEKPMEELDEASQAKIKQMMFDESQKRLGLPTSEEQRKIELLKEAWDADGSPFKGQPFDPSILKNN